MSYIIIEAIRSIECVCASENSTIRVYCTFIRFVFRLFICWASRSGHVLTIYPWDSTIAPSGRESIAGKHSEETSLDAWPYSARLHLYTNRSLMVMHRMQQLTAHIPDAIRMRLRFFASIENGMRSISQSNHQWKSRTGLRRSHQTFPKRKYCFVCANANSHSTSGRHLAHRRRVDTGILVSLMFSTWFSCHRKRNNFEKEHELCSDFPFIRSCVSSSFFLCFSRSRAMCTFRLCVHGKYWTRRR